MKIHHIIKCRCTTQKPVKRWSGSREKNLHNRPIHYNNVMDCLFFSYYETLAAQIFGSDERNTMLDGLTPKNNVLELLFQSTTQTDIATNVIQIQFPYSCLLAKLILIKTIFATVQTSTWIAWKKLSKVRISSKRLLRNKNRLISLGTKSNTNSHSKFPKVIVFM